MFDKDGKINSDGFRAALKSITEYAQNVEKDNLLSEASKNFIETKLPKLQKFHGYGYPYIDMEGLISPIRRNLDYQGIAKRVFIPGPESTKQRIYKCF